LAQANREDKVITESPKNIFHLEAEDINLAPIGVELITQAHVILSLPINQNIATLFRLFNARDLVSFSTTAQTHRYYKLSTPGNILQVYHKSSDSGYSSSSYAQTARIIGELAREANLYDVLDTASQGLASAGGRSIYIGLATLQFSEEMMANFEITTSGFITIELLDIAQRYTFTFSVSPAFIEVARSLMGGTA
jgi:hypothetical protein